jgi:tetraprenyl-beta-curcumene synthase
VGATRETAAAASALGAYLTTVLPGTRQELRRWRRIAEAIPDPERRRQALEALTEKASNVEAVAVFATLAPRRRRRAVLRAIVPLQVAIDYLDTLEEAGIVEPADGGYLAGLQRAWRDGVAVLPAAATTADLIERAVRRCGEGQSHTHQAEHGDASALEDWARRLPEPTGYRWWELAAGASSSVAAHALIAAAATPVTTARQAELIDAAYNPSIGALTVLLDALVDRQRDHATGAHNYTDYYSGPEDAARRIADIGREARDGIFPLSNRGRHMAILAGVAGFYLGEPGARNSLGRPVAAGLEATLGPSVRLIGRTMAALRSLRAKRAQAPDANSPREPG